MTAIASPTTAKPVRAGESALTKRQARLAMIMLAPTFLVLLLVAFYPLARTFLASFTDEPFANPNAVVNNVGFANYERLFAITIAPLPEGARLRDAIDTTKYQRVSNFTIGSDRYVLAAGDPVWLSSIVNTVVYTIISVTLELMIGLGVALVVNNRFRGRGIMRAVMLIPWAIPTAISTVLWRDMLKDNSAGAVNALLVGMGILEQPIAWLAQQPLISVIFVDVWKTVPFMSLLLLAGLQTIPGDLYEAGAVDGATTPQRFFRITLPLLLPTILIALIFRTLDSLRAFDVFQVLLGRATPSMAVYNYEKLTSDYAYGFASATGVVIFILIFAFTILYMSLARVETD
ncbi:MAG: sugar ABC transporter permease [Anaerolineae bacterium]